MNEALRKKTDSLCAGDSNLSPPAAVCRLEPRPADDALFLHGILVRDSHRSSFH